MRGKFKNLIVQYKHSWILLYLFIYLPWFIYLEQTVTHRYNIIHMAIDDYIPFLEIFIIPYLLWFAYVAVAVIYFFFTNVSDYYKLCFFLFTGMTIFLIISTIYPNGHNLRPMDYNDNIFASMVQILHQADTPTNILPSIHVYNSVGVHIAISHSEKLKKYKWLQISSFILMFNIILSTVFLKQHSVFDIITGLMLAAVMYYFVYAVDWQKGRRKAYDKQVSSNI